MATPVSQHAVDKRRTCSICLEAFRGRQPKILSCFHTFCSPCLLQLVDREARQSAQMSSSAQGGEGRVQTDSPATLTCPTCRTSVLVPSGGVSQLQMNFYLEEEAADDPSPVLCDFCEEGQKAEFQCANCINNFCSHCLDFHDQLCKSPAASLITDSTGSAGTQSVGKESQDLAQRMEDVLKKVAEEEKKLALERRDIERDIHVRYTTLMDCAADARDSSLTSLRDVTQAVSDSLMNTASLAREVLNRAKDKTSGCHPRDPKGEVLTESTRLHFEELLKKANDEALLTYAITDSSTHLLQQYVSDFMSTVVATGSNVDPGSTDPVVADGQPSGTSKKTGNQRHQNADLPENTSSLIGELTAKLQDLSARFTQNEKVTAGLEAQNALLCRDLVAVQDNNVKVSDDFTVLQKEMTSLRDDLTSQRRDFVHIRDKTSLLSQDNDSFRSDLSTLKMSHDQIQTNQKKLQTDCDKVQTDCHKVQTDYDKLQTDYDTVQTDMKQLQFELDQHQAQLINVEGHVDQLQVDQRLDQTELKTDQDKLTSQVQTLKTNVGQLKNLCKKDTTAIAGLETRLSKVNKHVAFHAILGGINDLTVTQPQTIVCDTVMTNVGGGYNGQTGVFTAPVSGTYCFMASSTPGSDDHTKRAALDIKLADKNVGYLSVCGKGQATAHCAVHVQAGQTVRLRSYHDARNVERTFVSGWFTSFTGMLLQPDL